MNKYNEPEQNKFEHAIKITKTWRGYKFRRSRLPNSLLYVKHLLKDVIQTTESDFDGRLNSSIDEVNIINKLCSLIPSRIEKVRKRHWYDFKLYDYRYGWLPVNIKSTNMRGSDNTSNFAMCLYALTDVEMCLNCKYLNSKITCDLFNFLKEKRLTSFKRDYYFLVLNKRTSTIIVNSFRGLTKLTKNSNNLPFQINWNQNKHYTYNDYNTIKTKFINVLPTYDDFWFHKHIDSIQTIKENDMKRIRYSF